MYCVMKKFAPLAAVGVLLLVGAGCGKATVTVNPPAAQPVAPAAEEAAQPKADGFVSAIRAKLAMGSISYTDKSEMSDVAKMQNKDAVSDAVKFKVSGGTGSVRVLLVSVNDASKLEAVKAEMKAQYDQLLTLSKTTRITWLMGDATHIVLTYYSVEDEALAQKVVAAIGADPAMASAQPAATAEAVINIDGGKMEVTVEAKPSATASFKAGDKVLANWKNGSKWWEAVVTKVDGPAISVVYDSDKTTDTLAPTAVVMRPSKAAVVKVGDKVTAKWNGGSFYGGTITAVTSGKATVKWGDGSAPSEVALTDMVVLIK